MAYPTSAPVVRLSFSDGFKFHGPDTALTVTATVNLPVPAIKHLGDNTELADGQVLAGPLADFRVPNPQAIGWATPAGSRVQGWSYDLAVTVTAPGAPDALWVATIRPANGVETITPGMGTLTGGGGASGSPARIAVKPFVSGSHRAKLSTLGGLTNGTDTGAMTRVSQAAPYRLTEIALGYSNVYSTASRESPGPNPITVRAALEYDGVFYPLFLNGSRDMVIASGGYGEFAPAFVDIPKGATYYVRTLVTVAAGGKWPYGVHTGASYLGDGVEQGTSVTDKTTSGTVTGSNNYAYGPTFIKARRIDDTPGVASVGDSIAYGSGDSIDRGTIVRALDGKLPLHNMGYPGAQASDFVARYSGLRIRLAAQASHWIVLFGTNDISANKTAAEVKAALQAVYQLGADLGVKVWAGTIPPRTTSTDAWATTGSQTKAATEAVRVEVNNWIRTKPAPLAGYFDTADTWETARNSGIWKPAITNDGIHPNGDGATAGAAAIDASKLV